MIYFVQVLDPYARIKIGRTEAPISSRLASIRGACPYQVKLLGTMAGNISDELALHRQFAEHAVIGEWFDPAPEILAFCDGLEKKAISVTGGDYANGDIYVRLRLPPDIYQMVAEVQNYRNFSFRAALVSLLNEIFETRKAKEKVS